jgi:two-component system chemotaxis response regulator CheV
MNDDTILTEAGTNELEVIEFHLDTARGTARQTTHYAINVTKVLEIIRKPAVTSMPSTASACVLGTFNYRGRVIPLLDLKRCFNQGSVDNDRAMVIVTEFNQTINAFLVSGVNRIHRFGWKELVPPGQYLETLGIDCITGMFKLDDRILFMVDLERIVAEINPESALIELTPSDRGSASRIIKVLHADDSAMIRAMVSKELQKDGSFEIVTSARDGEEGLQALYAFKEQARNQDRPITDFVDAAVLDIEMPSRDGFSLCRTIKEDPGLQGIAVIMFSSMITERIIHKCQSVGADGQVSKPDLARIRQTIAELLPLS